MFEGIPDEPRGKIANLWRPAAASGLALAANVLWLLLGFALFTARGNYDWYYITAGLLVLLFIASLAWFAAEFLRWCFLR